LALLLSIVDALLQIALLSMIGQLVVGLFAWRRRDQNAVYQLLALVTRPLVRLLRRIAPRRLSDSMVSAAAFVVLCCAYLGVFLVQRSVCLADIGQPGCDRWLAAVRAGQLH